MLLPKFPRFRVYQRKAKTLLRQYVEIVFILSFDRDWFVLNYRRKNTNNWQNMKILPIICEMKQKKANPIGSAFCSFPLILDCFLSCLDCFVPRNDAKRVIRAKPFSIHNSSFRITSCRPFRRPWASEVWEA